MTLRVFPLPFPFIFTASGNAETTPPHPIDAYTHVLRSELRSHIVDGYRVQALRRENRTELVEGTRVHGIRRESRLAVAA